MDLVQRLQALHADLAVLGPDALQGRDPGWDPNNLGASVMALPASTEAAAAVISWCWREGIPMVPHGGRTGLMGGAVSRPGEVIVSTARMTAIERLDPLELTAIVQAGVTLEALQDAARAHGLDPGIDLPARGSATLGGMVATNAGGLLAFRNGNMRHRVLGLEVVLPDGRVMNELTRVVKTSAGYDLKHLFIGAEGTLGLVTRIAAKLEPVEPSRATAFLAVPDTAATLEVVRHFLGAPSGSLRAAEMMWANYARRSAAGHGLASSQLALDAPAFLLLELAAATSEEAATLLEQGIEAVWEHAGLLDGTVAQTLEQRDRLWRLRENTEPVQRSFAHVLAFDISVPPSLIDGYVAAMQQRLAAVDSTLEACVYGHVADGNLHIMVGGGTAFAPELVTAVEGALYTGLRELGGSFSAEHGIGLKKKPAYARYADPVRRELATGIKAVLDPKGLFNPGKVV